MVLNLPKIFSLILKKKNSTNQQLANVHVRNNLFTDETSNCSPKDCINFVINTFLQNNKILFWSKLRGLREDKSKMAETLEFILDKVENIVGKGENADCQHFLLFPQCFSKCCFSTIIKTRDCLVKG